MSVGDLIAVNNDVATAETDAAQNVTDCVALIEYCAQTYTSDQNLAQLADTTLADATQVVADLNALTHGDTWGPPVNKLTQKAQEWLHSGSKPSEPK